MILLFIINYSILDSPFALLLDYPILVYHQYCVPTILQVVTPISFFEKSYFDIQHPLPASFHQQEGGALMVLNQSKKWNQYFPISSWAFFKARILNSFSTRFFTSFSILSSRIWLRGRENGCQP